MQDAMSRAEAAKNTAKKLSCDPLWRQICALELEVYSANEMRKAALEEVAVAKRASSMAAVRESLQKLEELLTEAS